MTAKEQAESLIDEHVILRKQEVEIFWEWLNEQGFCIHPASSASTKHNAYEGGLLDHSLGVTANLFDLCTTDSGKFKIADPETFVIVGLFHDAHKCCDGFGRSYYVPNKLASGNVSAAKPYVRNKDRVTLCGGYQSVLLVSKYVPLLEAEMQAMAHHDGLFTSEGRAFMNIPDQLHPLTYMLHFADFWSGVYEEKSFSLLKKTKNSQFFCD